MQRCDPPADHATLSAVLAAFPWPALIVGADRRIRAVNSAFQSRLQPGRNAVGAHCYEVLHARRRPCPPRDVPCPLKACVRTRRATPALHSHRLDGEVREEQILLRPLADDDGAVVACLATLRR
jgi:hypothetical protein